MDIGTAWEIETPSTLEMPPRRILARTKRFDATHWRFRSDPLISGFASSSEGGCFTFGLEHPFDAGLAIGVARLRT